MTKNLKRGKTAKIELSQEQVLTLFEFVSDLYDNKKLNWTSAEDKALSDLIYSLEKKMDFGFMISGSEYTKTWKQARQKLTAKWGTSYNYSVKIIGRSKRKNFKWV